MSDLARDHQPLAAALAHMQVRGIDGDTLVVADAGGLIQARRAKGCLVEPAPGDLVLVSRAGDESYVLAVLEGPGPTRLAATGPLDIASATRLTLSAPELETEAGAASITIDRLAYRGTLVDIGIEGAKLVAERVHVMAADALAELGRSIRRIAGLDQSAAGIIDQRAEDSIGLHGRFTTITADKDVRIDGDQIHMG